MNNLDFFQGLVVMWWYYTDINRYNRFATFVKSGMNIREAYKIVRFKL